jgi:hypothetical protein
MWMNSINMRSFSYNNIRHILYISYHGIIYSRCNARALTYKARREYLPAINYTNKSSKAIHHIFL